jgi:hypothetical protein
VLQHVYASTGDFNGAFEMSQLFIKMRDSVHNIENKNLLLKNQLKYEYEKKMLADSLKVNSERIAHKAELTQEKQRRYTLYAGMALLVLFGGLMYNRFQITNKQKKIIEGKNAEIELQKAKLEEKQKEIIDSIQYAQRIQKALIPSEKYFEKNIHRLNKN